MLYHMKGKTKTKKHFTHVKLNQYLTDIGATQEQFADTISVSPGYLNQILHGKRKPGINALMRLVEATGGYIALDDFHGENALYAHL